MKLGMMSKIAKTVSGRYSLTVALLSLLFLAAVVSLIWWSHAPQSQLPLGIAGIFLAWLMVVGLIAAGRIYRHMIRPVLQITSYLKSLARGEIPPPLNLRSSGRISFPELVEAANLLRDRMLDTSAKLRSMQDQERDLQRGDEGAQLLNRLMTAMARDFYQPLSAINGYAYALTLHTDPAVQQDLRERLQRQFDDISDRVTRISRLGALAARGADQVRQESFETAALIQEIESGSRKFLRGENLKMTLRYPNDFPARLQGDRGELRQLLLLLIRTIGSAASPGSRIDWTLSQEEHGLEFRFACSAYREISGDLPRILKEYHSAENGEMLDHAALPLLRLLWGESAAMRCQADLAVGYRTPFGLEAVLTLHPVWICEAEWGASAGTALLSGSQEGAPVIPEDAAVPGSLLLAGTHPDFADVMRFLYPACRVVLLPETGILPENDPDAALFFAGQDSAEELFLAASSLAKGNRCRLFAVVDERGGIAEQKLRSAGIRRFFAAPANLAMLDRMITGERGAGGSAHGKTN